MQSNCDLPSESAGKLGAIAEFESVNRWFDGTGVQVSRDQGMSIARQYVEMGSTRRQLALALRAKQGGRHNGHFARRATEGD